MTESLGALVRTHWASLLSGDFEVSQEAPARMVLHSNRVSVVVAADPRGEVDVAVTPLGATWPRQWSWSGMVGRADIGRLLELALDKMRAVPDALDGDSDFYDRLSAENQAKSRALTSQAEGETPPLQKGRLP